MNVGSDEFFIRLSEIHDPFDDADDVHDASQSTLEFWDHRLDDEDWNNWQTHE